MPERAAPSPAELRDIALRLLARREHAFGELCRKLQQRGATSETAATTVSALAEQGLQSDQRFSEGYLRSRAQRAYGPVRIRAELAERGIDRGLIDSTLRQADADWLSIAADWYQRRYGVDPVLDRQEIARRQQALLRRGFDPAVARELVS